MAGTAIVTSVGGAAIRRGRTYEFQVRANNQVGNGDWSPVGSGTTPTTVPNAPTNARARFTMDISDNSGGNANLDYEGRFLFTAPYDGGSAILEYDRERKVGSSPWVNTDADLGWPNTHTRQSVSVQSPRSQRERLGSVLGSWHNQAYKQFALCAFVPFRYTRRFHLMAWAVQLFVKRDAERNDGRGFQVQAQPAASGMNKLPSTSPIQAAERYAEAEVNYQSISFFGLTPGQSYQLQVRFTNSAGAGAWSPSSTRTS